MERRGFIKGLLASVAGGTALVKLTSEQEVAALTIGAPVAVGNIVEAFHIPNMNWSPEVYVRAPNGIFLCVGLLREVRMTQDITDIMTWDGNVVMVPGLKRGEFDFSGQA